jgi:hypothetical protein
MAASMAKVMAGGVAISWRMAAAKSWLAAGYCGIK